MFLFIGISSLLRYAWTKDHVAEQCGFNVSFVQALVKSGEVPRPCLHRLREWIASVRSNEKE